MRSDNAKLLLGLGLGILVGGAIGLYLAADKDQLKEDFDHLVGEVKDGAKNAYEKMKSNVEEAVSSVRAKAEDMEQNLKAKVEELKEEQENCKKIINS